MIILIVAILVAIRAAYSLMEIHFERDWPRRTWRGLALSLILFVLCCSCFGQGR